MREKWYLDVELQAEAHHPKKWHMQRVKKKEVC